MTLLGRFYKKVISSNKPIRYGSLINRIALIAICFGPFFSFGQIDVKINSGNPRIPFPQFLDYQHGKTLGRDNAIGVTDLEMEKTIREAYQIMMNRAVYTGEQVAGTKYIVFNPDGHGFTGPAPDVTEGDGYALLAMAYMADKPAFDGLFMYVNDNKRSVVEYFNNCGVIRNPDYPYGDGIAGWKVGEDDGAADGDWDIGMALLVAYQQWPTGGIVDDCGHLRTYKELAEEFIMGMVDTTLVMETGSVLDPSNTSTWVCPELGWGSCPYDSLNPDPRKIHTAPWGGFPGFALINGYVGWDGYPRIANTNPDVTNWIGGHPNNIYNFNGEDMYTYSFKFTASKGPFVDYIAPSYYREFANFLDDIDAAKYAFHVDQYRRAEASSDWLMGELHAKGQYPTAGKFTVNADGSSTSFSEVDFAEDSRNPWRTVLNYVWNGNPDYTWDPVSHTVTQGQPNTFEYDNGMRFAELADGWSENICIKLGNDPTELKFGGVATIGEDISTTDGSMTAGIGKHINWNLGSGAASIVAYHKEHNDENSKDLLADWYRQLTLLWDATDEGGTSPDNRYINSLPKYFHGWFRVLGLLVTTGNYQSPEFMAGTLAANVKVYNDVDKTLAYGPIVKNGVKTSEGDILTYKFSYRNFSSTAATGVQISYPLPDEYEFISASNGGSLSGGDVVWSIGAIPGYTSTGEGSADWKTFDPTKYPTYGEVTLKVRIKEGMENRIVCNQPTITANNSASHTSNEYPNNETSTMERNCVDIAKRSLTIVKRSDRTVMNDGDLVNFDIEFENSSDAGWVNGGRPGVRVTYANGFPGPNTIVNYFRVLHGADEPYINPGNYRVSYFLNDAARIGVYNPPANPNGWKMTTTILEGGDPSKVEFSSQQYTFGEDAIGKWNQRLIMKFPDTLMAITQHTNMFFAKDGEPNEVLFVHKGIAAPFRMAVQMEAIGAPGSGCGSIPMADLIKDDWSYTEDVDAGSNDKSLYFPITPSYFDFESTYDQSLAVPITDIHPDACAPLVSQTYDRILVEEWDGYIWRRILGNGPVPGRELENVCVYDTLPDGLEWQGFSDNEALGVDATYDPSTRVISWCVSSMLPGASGRLSYSAQAVTDCSSDKTVYSTAWITSDSDSPIDSTAKILITCDEIPPLPPGGSTIYKTANAPSYEQGDIADYTISFKQSDGTIAEPDLSTTDNWTSYCGEPILDFQNTRNPGGNPKLITYDYSHGTNGTLEVKIAAKLAAQFSLVFRHQGGTPVCGSESFEGLLLTFVNNSCAQADVTLTESGTTLGTKTAIAYAAPVDTMSIKVKLEGDKLYFWINNENALPYVFDGITLMDPGYVGFYNTGPSGNSNESHKLLYWYTHFDSAFDVELSDKLPGNLVLDGSTLQKTYDENGVYSNDPVFNGTDEIAWTLVSGKTPMLYGDSVQFVFSGEVSGCPQKYLTNISYANMYGQPVDFIGAQAVSECGTPSSCAPPTLANLSPLDTTICEDGTATLTVSTDAKTGMSYTWYKDGASPMIEKQGDDLKSINVSTDGSYYLVIADKTDATCNIESDPVSVNVNLFVDPGTIGSDQVICSGDVPMEISSTQDASGGTGVYTYTWEYFNGVSWTELSSPDDSVYNSLALSSDRTFRRKVESGVCAAEYSNEVDITITEPLDASVSILGLDTICLGVEVDYLATPVNGGTAPSYQWYINSNPVAGETDSLFTTDILTDGDTVSVNLVSSISCVNVSPVSSNDIIVTVDEITPTASVDITSAGGNQVCAGEEITFEVIGSTGTSGPDNFIWYVNNAPEGTTGTLFRSSTLSNGDSVFVEVVSGLDCASSEQVFSNKIGVIVSDDVTPSAEIDASSMEICSGEEVSFNVISSSGISGPDNLIWYINSSASGVTGDNFDNSTLKNEDTVYVEVVSGLACAASGQFYSNKLVIVVNENVTPSFEIKATSEEICAGDPVTFTAINMENEGNAPGFTWFHNSSEIIGETLSSFTTSSLVDNDEVYAVLTSNANCLLSNDMESNAVTIKVSTSLDPAVFIATDPASDTSVCEGQAVTFEVTGSVAKGTNPAYQWNIAGNPVSGAIDSVFTAIVDHGDEVTVTMTTNSSCASTPTAISDPITMEVIATGSPLIGITASETDPLCPGEEVSIHVSSRGDLGSPVYAWYKDDELIPGETDSIITVSEGGTYYLEAISSLKCVVDPKAISGNVIVSNSVIPDVAISASKNQFCSYEASAIEATNSIGDISEYTWKSGTGIINQGLSSSISVEETGIYYLVYENSDGCIDSTSTLNIEKLNPLNPTISPDNPEICPGGQAQLSSDLTGAGYSYIWLDELESPISGETASSFATGPGVYSLIVNDGLCSDTSGVVTVTEKVLVVPVILGNDIPFCRAQEIFSIENPSLGSEYIWSLPVGASILSGQNTSEITVQLGDLDGTITVLEKLSDGCESEVGSFDFNLQKCDLAANFDADKYEICQGEAVTYTNMSLGTSSSAVYTWEFGSGASPSTLAGEGPHTVTYSSAGAISPKLIVSDGLTVDTIKTSFLTVHALPETPVISGASPICSGSSATYSSSAQGIHSWSVTGGSITSGQGTKSVNVLFNNPGISTISLEVENQFGCGSESVDKTIDVEEAEDLNIVASSDYVCKGNVENIVLSGANGAISWYWNDDLILGENDALLEVSQGGEFYAQVQGTCLQTSEKVSIVKVNFGIDAGPDQAVEVGNSVAIRTVASHNVISYQWDPALSPVANPTFTPTETNIYTVKAISVQGCIAYDNVKITVIRPLFIPNAFTPNGDGIHDVWEVTGLELYDQGVKVVIYNRWGEVVYEGKGSAFQWDGKIKGVDLPVATYYYVIDINNDDIEPITGSILLAK